jgi:L,D-peptidoglycan transpeptidase YkuD (ErfK/YbiS/YcfS/YnhG family)
VKSSYSRIIIRKRPGGAKNQGIMAIGGMRFVCALGGGMSSCKIEGDGKTPIGRFRIISGFYRADRVLRPKSLIYFKKITPNLGWCDDKNDRNYNKRVTIPYKASHEKMFMSDQVYDIVMVLDYNIYPRIINRGSAIFFHVAKEGLPKTAGCVALPLKTLQKLLPFLSPQTVITIKN